MTTKYPPSERVTAGRLTRGDELLIRERQTDQPCFVFYEHKAPLATGVWTVLAVTPMRITGFRRAKRVYELRLSHPGAGNRVIEASPGERFNRVTS